MTHHPRAKSASDPVLRVQIAFEPLGSGELPEHVPALLRTEAVGQASRLELILQPQALVGIGNVRELRADRTGVNEFELRQDVAQFHALGTASVRLPVKNSVSRSAGDRPKYSRSSTRGRGWCVRFSGSSFATGLAIRPDLDEARYRRLLGAGRAARSRVGLRRSRGGNPRLLGACGDVRLDLAVRPLTGYRRGETLKVSTPTRLYTRGIAKILLVEGVEEIGVAAVERC